LQQYRRIPNTVPHRMKTSRLHMGDTMAPSKSCRSTDTNVLLAIITKWEDMGCTPGTTPGYSSLPRTHKTQKPSASQGLYPILLLALSALTTSAYTGLGVSQDSNPQCQLLKKRQSTTQPHQLRVCRIQGAEKERHQNSIPKDVRQRKRVLKVGAHRDGQGGGWRRAIPSKKHYPCIAYLY
jgi:hypothetical protein